MIADEMICPFHQPKSCDIRTDTARASAPKILTASESEVLLIRRAINARAVISNAAGPRDQNQGSLIRSASSTQN